MGYTRDLLRAGRYSKAQAEQIVAEANQYRPQESPFEIMLPDPIKPMNSEEK